MPTAVGTETTIEKLVQNLLILEHDAISSYDWTIDTLDDDRSKEKVAEFRADHQSHVAELIRLAKALGTTTPEEGDFKEYLTTGKVALASLVGDKTILKAMSTNEVATKLAYDQASKNDVATPDARAFFLKAYADESRHKDWMDAAVAS